MSSALSVLWPQVQSLVLGEPSGFTSHAGEERGGKEKMREEREGVTLGHDSDSQLCSSLYYIDFTTHVLIFLKSACTFHYNYLQGFS